MKDKMIVAEYDSKCCICGKKIEAGTTVMWQPGEGVACLEHYK